MKIVSFSEAINSLKTMFDRVVDDTDYTIVTRIDDTNRLVYAVEDEYLIIICC